jgi:predicted nucleic acid-binding protein
MSRVFWDAMLFIYLLEDNRKFAPQVRTVLAKSRQRGDQLLTSHLSLAEALVGTPGDSAQVRILRQVILEMGFVFVAFDEQAVEPFRRLRTDLRLKQPDSMHLACAAAVKTDLFLTGDKQLLKKHLHVPGIQFIADFEHPPF